MGKKIAVINDLSGFGHCSLTAAIPVISAMGVQACPVPTAILSAQTGFPDYYCDTCTEYLPVFTEKWKAMDAAFDGIYTGFTTDADQARAMITFVDAFRDDDTQVLVDPILGDDGVKYKLFSDEVCNAVKELASHATIITPNLTELCILTDTDYSSLDHEHWEHLQKQIAAVCADHAALSGFSILVTGICHKSGHDGPAPEFADLFEIASSNQAAQVSGSTGAATSVFFNEGVDAIATGIFTEGKWTACDAPLLPGSFSGTGDLFASVIIAAVVGGLSLKGAVQVAQDFLTTSIADSIRAGIYPPEGTDFEPHLNILMDRVRKQ